jgi:ABC-type uncharacterized transport system involved in gliding motility auxiliary subunit
MTNVEPTRRRVRWASWSGAALVAGILLVLNFIMSYVPVRLDTSEGRVYSISQGSKDILKKLDDRMIVRIVFSRELPATYKLNQKYLEDLLAEYKRASHGHLRVEYMDPGASSQGRQLAIDNGIAPVQLDVRERDRREVKECFMGVAFQYGDRKTSIQLIQDTNNLEYEISSRIRKLLSPGNPKVGLVSSGDSLTLDSKALETLAAPFRQLYDIRNIDLSQPVPSDVQSVWMIGPKKELSATELANLTAYASSGGVVGLLLNRYSIEITKFLASPLTTGLDGFLDAWGLGFKNGLIVDPQCDRIQIQAVQGAYRMVNVVDYPYFPWISDLNRAQVTTKGLDGLALPFAAAIETKAKKPGFTYTSLGRSSKFSFLDPKPVYMNPLAQHTKESNDESGPFDVGMIAQGTFPGASKPSRLVLFGTSHFVESDYPARQGNYSLLANLIDWSVQDEVLIQIRARGFERRPLKDFSEAARAFFKLAFLGLLPLLTMIVGILVWRRQKVRRLLLPLTYRES